MNFRECRQGTLLELIRHVDDTVDAHRAFLMCGGMRNAYYVIKYRGVKLLAITGCGETNVPGIFEILDIPYSVIKAHDFWDTFVEESKDNENFYVLPVVRAMLNTDSVDMDNYQLVGQSYFLVDHVEDDKMYFSVIDQNNLTIDNFSTYITKNVINTCNNSSEWAKEADFEAYRINKEDLKKSTIINALINLSEKELLYKNIAEFDLNEKMVGEQGTVRYDGEQVYSDIAKYLENLLDYLKQVKDTEKYKKFMNFVYLQFINFRKMLVAGTDCYYRSEFYEIIQGYPEFSSTSSKWKALMAKWRKFGRTLSAIESKREFMENNMEQYIEEIINEWHILSIEERELMLEMQDIMMENDEIDYEDLVCKWQLQTP